MASPPDKEAPKGPYKLWAGYSPFPTRPEATGLTANEPMPAGSAYTPDYSTLYLGYGSNLSPLTMKQRCPDSLFIGLARLDDWRWQINSTQYANVVPSKGDQVYGALFFLSRRDEAMLDQSEGVPWLYERQHLEVSRLPNPSLGFDSAETVTALVYVDVQRTEDGAIEPDYVVWVNKAIREGGEYGLPSEYVEKYLRPFTPLPPSKEEEEDIAYVRILKPWQPKDVIQFGGLQRKGGATGQLGSN